MSYDGFISYSHAADGQLAPRLQVGLQRFAKPWWQRRALRIFRDESSLSANPRLWSSITDALDASGWFVLLLSPDAARSEWVNQEVAYWVEHKDPDRIVPVLTDGEFGWSDGDVVGDSVPSSLQGVLSEEPRWVDARTLGDPETLDLKNPEFAAVVADLASPLRGIPKDELAGEEVRQHRRTVRTALAGGVLVVALAIAAVGFGVQAISNANEAERLADVATSRQEEAERQAEAARTAEGEALVQAANAEARRLAVSASAVQSEDPQLATLLALAALGAAADDEVRGELGSVLRDAVSADRLLARIEVPSSPERWGVVDTAAPPLLRNSPSLGALAPEGGVAYHLSRPNNLLLALDTDSSRELWRFVPPGGDQLMFLSVSPTSGLVAVSALSGLAGPGRIVLLDPATGEVMRELTPGGCPVAIPAGGFSPDGRWFAVHTGTASCVGTTRVPESDWVAVFDTATWEEGLRVEVPGGRQERLQVAGDVALLAYNDDRSQPVAELIRFPGLEPIEGMVRSSFWPEVSPSGAFVVGELSDFQQRGAAGAGSDIVDPWGVRVWLGPGTVGFDLGWRFDLQVEAETENGFNLFAFADHFEVSPDESLVAVASRGADGVSSGLDAVLDPRTGRVELILPKDGDTFDLSWSADGATLLTVQQNEMLLWEVVPDPARLNPPRASQDWVGFALAETLQRGFSPAECSAYRLDPCPTSLDEVRVHYAVLTP